MDLPVTFPAECTERLIGAGLARVCQPTDQNYFPPEVEYLEEFLKPKRHIPPTNPTNDLNTSPVEGSLFAACRSMQNIQETGECGGCNKYLNKYCAKGGLGN